LLHDAGDHVQVGEDAQHRLRAERLDHDGELLHPGLAPPGCRYSGPEMPRGLKGSLTVSISIRTTRQPADSPFSTAPGELSTPMPSSQRYRGTFATVKIRF